MASTLTSPLGISGIITTLIAAVLFIIGLVVVIAKHKKIPMYGWLLLAGGVVLGLIGITILIYLFATRKQKAAQEPTNMNF
jgi:hypothetical protein